MGRDFLDTPAVRERVPLLIGLVGPSGSGKTYSALRLATGIQRVDGGEIFFIDTEARRALHYASMFEFRHVDFHAPFGPLDYLAAIDHCIAKGAKIIVVDSMSHEHEGPGGVLDQHEAETGRLVKQWKSNPDKVKFSAWVKPKAERRRLLNSIVQRNVHFIFCFRAKEKLKITPGKDPVNLGWQAIAGEEFVYEMTMSLYLPPGGKGRPDLQPAQIGEKALLKVPQQFREMVTDGELDERLGEALARWADGGAAPLDEKSVLLDRIKNALVEMAVNAEDPKKAKAEALRTALGCKTWKEVQALSLDRLRSGLAAIFGPGAPPEGEPEAEDGASPVAPEDLAATAAVTGAALDEMVEEFFPGEPEHVAAGREKIGAHLDDFTAGIDAGPLGTPEFTEAVQQRRETAGAVFGAKAKARPAPAEPRSQSARAIALLSPEKAARINDVAHAKGADVALGDEIFRLTKGATRKLVECPASLETDLLRFVSKVVERPE